MAQKLSTAFTDVQGLKGELQQSAEIEKFISEHKEQLKTQLAQYSNMLRNLKAINQEYYYYHAQEYMTVFRDPKKAEQKAIALLQKLPAYTDFIKRFDHCWAV
jgi:conjugal transfer/entry exclusion protein